MAENDAGNVQASAQLIILEHGEFVKENSVLCTWLHVWRILEELL